VPDCDTCRPKLLEENFETLQVWQLVENQVIVGGMGTIIDINIPAIIDVMKIIDVEDEKQCLMNIVNAFRILNAEEQEDDSSQPDFASPEILMRK